MQTIPLQLRRSPLHYCVTLKERGVIWPILQDGGADPNQTDVVSCSDRGFAATSVSQLAEDKIYTESQCK